MTLNPFVWNKKRKLKERMGWMLETDRAMIKKGLLKVSMAKHEEAPILALPAPKVLVRRVDIPGADEIYEAINESNYRSLAASILMTCEEDELLVALCVIDKCDEFQDYETMITAYKHLDVVLRYTKDDNDMLAYARRYRNRVGESMMDRGIY